MKRKKSQHLSHQLRFIANAIIGISVSIFAVLIYFQIYHGDFFDRSSKRNCLRHKMVHSLRGAILDRHGKSLATNRPVTLLVWRGSGNREFSEKQQETLDRLRTIIGTAMPSNETLLIFERRGDECIICPDLPFETLCRVMEQCATSTNLTVKTESMRFYPFGTVGCHVIGYFRGSLQHRGTFGLEKLYEEQLRGEPGEYAVVVNAVGQNLEQRNIKEAQDGSTLQTTIDFDIQMIAESIFEENQVGALVAMDPFDGSILAVVSRPAFDPNIFVGPVDEATWRRYVEQKPFINRAFAACYPPASLFKLITATAALEEGIVTPQSCWTCTGSLTFGNREFHCNKDKIGHGTLNFEQAIAFSCNIPFYEIGKRIHIDRLAEYARMFGLGSPTGISLPEKAGFIPTTAWKKRQYGEPWWPGETVISSIGQAYVLVTPLQVARMIGGVCTGNLVKPRLLANEQVIHKSIPVSATTRDFIKKSMHSATTKGTGKALSSLKNMELYAKTGTAQTNDRSKHKLGDIFLPHGWFASYAQYKDHDPIVLVIIVEHAGSSSVPASMAKKFYLKYCELLDGPQIPQPPMMNGTSPLVQTPVAQPDTNCGPTKELSKKIDGPEENESSKPSILKIAENTTQNDIALQPVLQHGSSDEQPHWDE